MRSASSPPELRDRGHDATFEERFELVRAPGSGGMASVCEVIDRQTQQRLALKRLHTLDDAQRQRRSLELHAPSQ